MNFKETRLKEAFLIEPELIKDNRGFVSRLFSNKEFQQTEINMQITESLLSQNKLKGTIRGMHYQQYPFEQAKLVRCVKGSIYAVIIDIREYSPTRFEWYGKKLTAKNHSMLYAPKGFAHGFQTLEDDTVVEYLIEGEYNPSSGRGLLWKDPRVGIKWPITKNVILSTKDTNYALLVEEKC